MSDDHQKMGQDEIERLLQQSQTGKSLGSGQAASGSAPLGQHEIEALLSGKSPAAVPASPKGAAPDSQEPQIAPGDVDFLLSQAQEALASIDAPAAAEAASPATPFQLHEFTGASPSTERATLDLIRDVDLDLKIELGRTQMYLEDVLKLRRGTVVPLDKLAGDPVDIYVNGRLIARGEVLVLNDNFCVRVAELISSESAKAG
jgi:flagellar motor switch protein FliN/FliY